MSRLVIDWQPPTIEVAGEGRFPVRQVWCVGRNYAEHAREMGADPEQSPPVFFSKPAQALTNNAGVDYPSETDELHHEVELVVFLKEGGRRVPAEDWPAKLFGYAVGVDLTRRDVQARLKKAGQPWEISKGFDQSGPVGLILPASQWQPNPDKDISLQVNGVMRQRGTLGEMVWPVAKLLERLSTELTLNAGDVVFTGTPAGVGPLVAGNQVIARIEGLPELAFTIGAA